VTPLHGKEAHYSNAGILGLFGNTRRPSCQDVSQITSQLHRYPAHFLQDNTIGSIQSS